MPGKPHQLDICKQLRKIIPNPAAIQADAPAALPLQ